MKQYSLAGAIAQSPLASVLVAMATSIGNVSATTVKQTFIGEIGLTTKALTALTMAQGPEKVSGADFGQITEMFEKAAEDGIKVLDGGGAGTIRQQAFGKLSSFKNSLPGLHQAFGNGSATGSGLDKDQPRRAGDAALRQ